MWSRKLFYVVFQVDLIYVQILSAMKTIFYKPFNRSFKNVYKDFVVKIDEFDTVIGAKYNLMKTSNTQILCNIITNQILNKCYNEVTVTKSVQNIKKLYTANIHGIFYLATYANGKSVIYRNTADIHLCYPIEFSKPTRQYLMVLVDNHYDITPFYLRTIGSINKGLGITAHQLAVIATTEMFHTKNTLIGNHMINLTTIDNETFEERTYKGTEVVIL